MGRRGRPPALDDAALLVTIRAVIAESPFHGDGHRKIWARLRARKGVRTSMRRVLRVMREAELLAPARQPDPVVEHLHDGTIVTDRPNVMWGTDATATVTLLDGHVTVFAAIDHCTAECVGIHAAIHGDRFEALEPLRQGVRDHFGGLAAAVAAGLAIRHDHGSVYMSADVRAEITFLGMTSSPAFVRQPEGNGCIERFFRTVKEPCVVGLSADRRRAEGPGRVRLRHDGADLAARGWGGTGWHATREDVAGVHPHAPPESARRRFLQRGDDLAPACVRPFLH